MLPLTNSALPRPRYTDPIGLDGGNVSSARDLVTLATELRRQAMFRKIVDTPRTTLRSTEKPIQIVNRNSLVLQEPFIDGIKTGTTLEAGYVLVGSGTRDGVGLTSVVLGSPDETSRDAATLALMDYGFSLYDTRALVRTGERLGFVSLVGGGRLALKASGSVKEVARADQRVEVELGETPELDAPIAEGESIGVAVVSLDGRRVGEVDAVAARAVAGLPEAEEGSSGLPMWALVVFAGAVVISAVLGALAFGAHRRE